VSILAEPPVAVVDKVANKKWFAAVARASRRGGGAGCTAEGASSPASASPSTWIASPSPSGASPCA
jgi:hypothetical protein